MVKNIMIIVKKSGDIFSNMKHSDMLRQTEVAHGLHRR